MVNISPEVVFGIPFDVGAQKIDSIILDTYRIIVAAFLTIDKANKIF